MGIQTADKVFDYTLQSVNDVARALWNKSIATLTCDVKFTQGDTATVIGLMSLFNICMTFDVDMLVPIIAISQ